MSTGKRVVIPTIYGAECPTIRSRLLPLCRELVSSGYSCTFFVAGVDSEEVEPGIYYRCYRSYLDLIRFVISLNRSDADIVLACKAYSITGLLSFIVSKIRKLEFVLDVDDRVFPSEIHKWWRLPLYLQELLAERLLMLLRPRTTAASCALAEYMGGHSVYIPNSADSCKFRRSDWDPDFIRKRYGIKKPVIIWPAVFFQETDRSYVFDVFRCLMSRNENVVLMVIGDGEYLPAIKDVAKTMSLNNVIFTGKVPYDEMPHYYASATAGMLPLRNNHYDACKGPIKLFEYMAMELPVIATKIGEPEEIVAKAACGILLPFDEPESAAAMIAELLESPEQLFVCGKNGRRYLDAHHSFATLAAKLLQVIENRQAV